MAKVVLEILQRIFQFKSFVNILNDFFASLQMVTCVSCVYTFAKAWAPLMLSLM